MSLKQLSVTEPASDDSRMHIRLYITTPDHMILKHLSDTLRASDDSTLQIRSYFRKDDYLFMRNSRWLNPTPMTQPYTYDLSLG